MLLGPADILDGEVDLVVEGDDRLAGTPSGSGGAEVGQPTVVRQPGGTIQLRISACRRIFQPLRLERQPVGEQNLSDDTHVLQDAQALVGIPL